jgi:hypothetical protein
LIINDFAVILSGSAEKEKKNTVSNIETVETPSDASTDAA